MTFATARDSDRILRAGRAVWVPLAMRDRVRPAPDLAPAKGGAGAGRALGGPVRCGMIRHCVAKAMAFAKTLGAGIRSISCRPPDCNRRPYPPP
ncbi:hypothetical protein GCM10011341_25970 [Frigidibacter albus]|nr:hypothetical protein GCM10011341_25970 [Frigidibacter albus]